MRAIRKAFTFGSHCLFYYLLASFLFGSSKLAPADQMLTLSAVFLTVVYTLFVHILRTYGNVFSRLLAIETLVFGIPLSLAALYLGGEQHVYILGAISLAAWVYFGYRFVVNTRRYEKQGAGPVPVDTCIKIPSELVRPGDAIATGGAMARLLRQGVGHTECVIRWEGKPMLFSSWFEEGAFLNEVGRILKPDPRYPNYLLQRRPPLTEEQIVLMEYVVRSMRRQNAQYKERLIARRQKFPAWLRNYLDKKFPVTGYDWLGRYTGRRAPDHWTCNVAYLEVMRRSCVDVVPLGHGAAGLRTGWFDFPNPEDLRADRALHLVRNAEVDALLQSGPPQVDLNADIAGFDAQVDQLVQASTNIFDRSAKAAGQVKGGENV